MKQIVEKPGQTLDLSGKDLGKLVRQFMESGKKLSVRVPGISMLPAIAPQDLICIAPYSGILPCPGDIVAYIDPASQRLTVHRLIRVARKHFKAKGDNCRTDDGILPIDCLIGRVIQVNEVTSFKTGLLKKWPRIIMWFLSAVNLLWFLNKCQKKAFKAS